MQHGMVSNPTLGVGYAHDQVSVSCATESCVTQPMQVTHRIDSTVRSVDFA
jgi:hypothetical protein